MAALLTLGALAACGEPLTAPKVPSVLVWHDEPPIGSELDHKLVRASIAVSDALKAKWGPVRPMIYTIAPKDRARLGEDLHRSLPEGWKPEQLEAAAPKGTTLHAVSSGDRLFAVLVIDPGEIPVIPVVVLRNDALLDTMKRIEATKGAKP